MKTVRITVRDGIGARVTAIANALSSGAERVIFGWAENEHCPLDHRMVFPLGVPGVEWAEPRGDCQFAPWNGNPFLSWNGAFDRSAADHFYRVIMDSMTGASRGACAVGVHARFFRKPHANPMALAQAAIEEASGRDVFLLSDMHRIQLANAITSGGSVVRCASCSELSSDLDRGMLETMLFLQDWKTLLSCGVIVTLDGPSCMLNPARAFGRRIIYSA